MGEFVTIVQRRKLPAEMSTCRFVPGHVVDPDSDCAELTLDMTVPVPTCHHINLFCTASRTLILR